MTSAQKALRFPIVRLPHAAGLGLPAYQTGGAAGMDLVAAVPEGKPVLLKPWARALIPTGLIFELPAGAEAQVRPRSGLALRHGVTVLNSPGTIDSDYRGEVQVLLVNLSGQAFRVYRGERIAQVVIQPVLRAILVEVSEASHTTRGVGGFGSTGVKAARLSASGASKTSTKTAARSTGKVATAIKPAKKAAAVVRTAAGRKKSPAKARQPAAKTPSRNRPKA